MASSWSRCAVAEPLQRIKRPDAAMRLGSLMTAPTPIGVYFFIFGVLLCGVCAFRINVRFLGYWVHGNGTGSPIPSAIS